MRVIKKLLQSRPTRTQHTLSRFLSDFVKIVEVGPRDGLQNVKSIVPTDIKVQLIDKLSLSGLKSIESTSFVSPKWVPQLADGKEVMSRISRNPDCVYPVLVPNLKGLESALTCGITEIGIFTAASEAFCKKNINCSIEESFERFAPTIELAKDNGIAIRGYVSCIAGCPYQGHVDHGSVAKVSQKLLEMGCSEISLGDTIGVGTPGKIKELLQAILPHLPVENLALHMHDTYGQAVANVYVGLDHGIRVFDSSVSGLGGCPYAQGASGNVATEDLIYMLHDNGCDTGVDIDSVIETGHFISGFLERINGSKVGIAKTPRS